MRTLVLLLALLPGLTLAEEPAKSPPPAPATAPPPPAKKTPPNQVYKWVDEKGVIHYTDKPPAEGAQPAKLPPLQTYKEGTKPNLGKFQKSVGTATGAPGGSSQVEIVTPSREETFRGGERVVPVAVMVTPQLIEGQKLIYLLDGTPASPAVAQTSYALTNVDRGAHTVSVTLIDSSGQELANSAAVTFYVHPPTVDQGKRGPGQPATPGQQKPKPKPPSP